MFDSMGIMIFFLKDYLQRIKDIFSFIQNTYFPTKEEEHAQTVGFSFF